MREIKLEDIDGTVKGRAALVIINLEDPWGEGKKPDMMRCDFDETQEAGYGPMGACRALWEATKGDWPGYHMSVVANDRARYLDWAMMMEAIGSEPERWTPEAYLQIEEP